MKKIKIIFSFLCVFCLCGCTIQYDLDLNQDLSLDEKILIKETPSFFQDYLFSTPAEVSKKVISVYEDELTTLGYKYEIANDGTTTMINHYNNYLTYIDNNRIFNQFFEDVVASQDADIVTIRNVGEFYSYTEGNPNYFNIQDIDINIKIPFKVIEHNADKVDKKNNIYTWKITKDTSNKSFLLKFDKGKKEIRIFNSEINIIIGVFLVLLILFLPVSIWSYRRYKKLNSFN